jgi:branched-chain amino acid transport system permease protein
MQLLIQQLINGVERGSMYALWAVGYGIVYQVLGLMHFAHGDTMLLTLYIAFAFIVTLSLPLYIAVPIVLLAAALLAMLVERGVYRPLLKRNDTTSAFIAALGAAYIIRNVATLVWGRDAKAFPQVLPDRMVNWSGISFNTTTLIVLAIALGVVAVFAIFLKRHRLGQAIVLVAQDRTTAALMGIPVPAVITMVYGLSGIIGAIGALLFATRYGGLDPSVGFFMTIQAFIAATVGGIGRLEGAIVGGLALGILEALVVSYISGLFVDGITWSILALVLLVRPTGFFGRKQVVKL